MPKHIHFACLLLLLTLGLSSCQTVSKLQNEEEQPQGVSDLSTFPSEVCGRFQSIENGKYLVINKDCIIKEHNIIFIQSIQELKTHSQFILSGDSLYNRENKEIKHVKIQGDTLFIPEQYFDTLFRVSSENILRKDRNCLFLNYKLDEADFRVKLLYIDENGYLTLSEPLSPEQIDEVKEPNSQELKYNKNGIESFRTYSFSLSQLDTLPYYKRKEFGLKDRFIRVSNVYNLPF